MKSVEQQLEFVDKILEPYIQDPGKRGVEENEHNNAVCSYLTDEGNKCAVGQCFTEDAIEKYGDYKGTIACLLREVNHNNDPEGVYSKPSGDITTIDDLVREEYRGYSMHLWRGVQRIHDCGALWNKEGKGLTERGKREVERFKEDIKIKEKVRQEMILNYS